MDFLATTGATNRWNTGMLKPVDYGDRGQAKGTLSWSGEPLSRALSVFGAPVLRCPLALDGADAALHVYLEARDVDGRVRYLTEGVARVGSGPARVRLLPIAFELPRGAALRVSLAGADADTFERVPATGARSMTFAAPCEVELPVVSPSAG